MRPHFHPVQCPNEQFKADIRKADVARELANSAIKQLFLIIFFNNYFVSVAILPIVSSKLSTIHKSLKTVCFEQKIVQLEEKKMKIEKILKNWKILKKLKNEN